MPLSPFTPPMSARQIAAKLTAIGYAQPEADVLALIYTNQLLLLYALDEQGIELPEQLINQLDGFDPDEMASTEGLTP